MEVSTAPKMMRYPPCYLVSHRHICAMSHKNKHEIILGYYGYTLAHRNRSDFCDLRLRCPSRTPEIARFPKQEKAMPHCDLRVRWKVASDLRFRAAISEPKTPFFCGISGDLAQSTRKSLAIAIVRFWCAKLAATRTRRSEKYRCCASKQVNYVMFSSQW